MADTASSSDALVPIHQARHQLERAEFISYLEQVPISNARRYFELARHSLRQHEKLELIAGAIVGIALGWLLGGGTWFGSLATGMMALFATLVLIFLFQWLRTPSIFHQAAISRIASLEAARQRADIPAPLRRDFYSLSSESKLELRLMLPTGRSKGTGERPYLETVFQTTTFVDRTEVGNYQLNAETRDALKSLILEEGPRLDIVAQSLGPFIHNWAGGQMYRVAVISSVDAIVRLFAEDVVFNDEALNYQPIPNVYLRITNDTTGQKNQTELHPDTPVYWDVVAKYSQRDGIYLTHVMNNLPGDIGQRNKFQITASSNKGPSTSKWVETSIEENGEFKFKLTDE